MQGLDSNKGHPLSLTVKASEPHYVIDWTVKVWSNNFVAVVDVVLVSKTLKIIVDYGSIS